MINSKKGLNALGVIGAAIVVLALAAVILMIQGNFFKGANTDIKSAGSCEFLGGTCVGSMSECSTPALKGYKCEAATPYCCQDEQYNRCAEDTWNTCESCQVKTINAVYLGSGKNGEPFKVKCAYNVNNVPCATMTISGKDVELAPDFCTVNVALSSDGEIVYDCPGTLLPGDYAIACDFNVKGTEGVDEKKTCCAANDNYQELKFTIK